MSNVKIYIYNIFEDETIKSYFSLMNIENKSY